MAIRLLLLIPAFIHLLPLSGLFGADALARLYGLDFSEPNLALLMRHRAALFGLLGVALAIAAFRSAWRAPAIVAGLVSVLSFLWLAWDAGRYNEHIARVVLADWVALACLLLAAILHWRAGRRVGQTS